MRLCTFWLTATCWPPWMPGLILPDDRVVSLRHALLAGEPPGPPLDLLDLVNRLGLETLLAQARALEASGPPDHAKHAVFPLEEVQLLAPLPRPVAITAVGLNYKDHATEQGKEPPAQPMLFGKHPTAVNAPRGTIELPRGRDAIDYECELAFVIGKGGDRIPRAKAREHILGFMVMNDVSDRKAQKEDVQYHRAKSWRGFAPLGPWVTTPDAFDPASARVRTWVNGDLRQDSSTSQLIFDPAFLVEYVSAIHPLLPGDVISTGTPGGVGVFRNPRVFLRAGDVVRCEVEGLGFLEHRFEAAG